MSRGKWNDADVGKKERVGCGGGRGGEGEDTGRGETKEKKSEKAGDEDAGVEGGRWRGRKGMNGITHRERSMKQSGRWEAEGRKMTEISLKTSGPYPEAG